MKTASNIASVVIIAVICLSVPAIADRVILKDGGIIQGKIVEQTQDKVTVEDIDGVLSSYEMGNVERVVNESRGSSPAEIQAEPQTEETPELVIQNGHSYWVNSVAFSPDGKTLASGGLDNTIRLWKVETGELVRELTGYSGGSVNSIAFSPDGKMLASGSGDGTIRLWKVETGELVRELSGHSSGILSVSFSPDGKTLASGSGDGTIRLWKVEPGELVRELEGHSDAVSSVSFGPDGKTLASGSGDNTIRLWSVETDGLVRELKGHSDRVSSVSFSPDGKMLASGSWDKTIRLWSVKTGELVRELKGDSVSSVSFSPDGKMLASGSGDGTIRLWSVETSGLVRKLKGHLLFVSSVSFSPDSKTIASGGFDRTIRLWSVETGRLVRKLKGHSDLVRSVAFSPDGKTLASGSDDQIIRLWSIETGDLVHELKGHSGSVWSVSFSPDGKTLASGSDDNTIKLWSVETGELIRSLEGSFPVAFSPDGKTIASGSADNMVKLWSVKTGELIHSLVGHTDIVTSVAFSPDGKTLASGSSYGTSLWNLETGRRVRELKGHSDRVSSISFSPDGKMLASGSWDHTIRLWSVKTGELVRELKGDSGWILSVSFSPDGKTLASGSIDYTIQLWSVETGELIRELKGHSSYVNSVTFSPDGKTLASGSIDTTVKLWNPETGQLLATLIAFDDGNWFVQDSAGRFDCSGCTRGDPNSGKKYIRWRERGGNNLYAPEQFFRKYFEPGLLADVVKMGYVPRIEDMGTALKDEPPEIKILEPADASSTGKDSIKVKIVVNELKNGGAENVRLFVNGRPVTAPPREITERLGAETPPYSDAPQGEKTYEFVAPLLPGENTLMALATSRSGIDSREAVISVTSTSRPAKKPDLYLVTVGINEYVNPRNNIILAVEDADGFADEINSRGKDLYSEIHDIRLRDAKATTDNLRKALDEVQGKAEFNDVVIIYYAGHGANYGKIEEQKESFSGGWYLVTHEISNMSRQYIAEHAFSDLELKAFLKRVKAGKVILVMDSCFSGAISETFTYGIGRDKNLVQLAYGSGASVLAAATGKQEAQATGKLGHGIFTHFLLDGMEGNADGVVDGTEKSQTVEVKELGEYTLKQVPAYAKQNRMQKQEPFFWQAAGGGSLGPTIVEVK